MGLCLEPRERTEHSWIYSDGCLVSASSCASRCPNFWGLPVRQAAMISRLWSSRWETLVCWLGPHGTPVGFV